MDDEMTDDRVHALEALLREAEAAHGTYEASELNGVYDEQWPRWYAGYAIDHGIEALLARPVTVDELADVLAGAWEELQHSDPKPPDPWSTTIARRIAQL